MQIGYNYFGFFFDLILSWIIPAETHTTIKIVSEIINWAGDIDDSGDIVSSNILKVVNGLNIVPMQLFAWTAWS